jgi:hypothetical protein
MEVEMLRYAPKINLIVVLAIVFSFILLGCAAPQRYRLKSPPTDKTKSFKTVVVSKVETGITESELEPETMIQLRNAILDEVMETKIYEKVAFECEETAMTLEIQPKVVEFDKGSRTARYLVGFGAGKGHLDVECKFLNRETQTVIAEGTFITELKGGLFGGGTNQQKMSQQIGEQVARFLKKGK